MEREHLDMKTLDEVLRIQAEVQDDLLKQPGVTGVDVAYRSVDGKQTDELVIRIFVADKNEALKRLQLPGEIKGVPVEVIERRFKLA